MNNSADFALGEKLETELAYWKEQLAGAPTVLDLLTDKPRSPVQTNRGAALRFFIGEELTEGLKKLSRQHDATLFMTLLAAFDLLLCRYTGQKQVLVGTPIANCNRSDTEVLIGFFVNTLVLRGDVRGNPSFSELLQRVRETVLGAYAHQDLPFEKLVEELQPKRDMSRSPLFQVLFMLQNTPGEALELEELSLSEVENAGETAKFELTIELQERGGVIVGGVEYNRDLYEAETIGRLMASYERVLQAVVADVEQRVLEIELLSEAERRQLIEGWNRTAAAYPRELSVSELFEVQAARTPEAIAVVVEDTALSYRELNERANQLARYLQRAGVGPEMLVGILMNRSVEMIVGVLGILKAGGAYVPLDPSYPLERLAFMVQDSGMRLLLTQRDLLAKVPELEARTIALDEEWEQIAAQSVVNPPVLTTPDNLAYVIYTSGSTGKPKGVQIQHRSLINLSTAMVQRPGLAAGDVFLSLASLSFDMAGSELFPPLINGACVVVVSREEAMDGGLLIARLETSGATVMQATPATWSLLLEAGWQRDKDLQVRCGGEAWRPKLAQELAARSSELWNLYGPTETTIWSSVSKVNGTGPVTLGVPIANTQLYVLDRHMQPVPIGVAGELYIAGDGLARGYLKRPELTAEKFVTNPFSTTPGERMYRTGDLVRYRREGALEYLGRCDQQVKVRGFRIELGEIETVLANHPGLHEVVVVVNEDKSGDKRLVAYVVGDGEEATDTVLRGYLRKRLPEYMVPQAFVSLPALPLTPNGKIDRRALQALEVEFEGSGGQSVMARTPVEESLSTIWAEVLGLETVSVHDSFFELGGHSLLATRVISRIRKVFGQEVALRALLENPTVASLARTIEGGQLGVTGPKAPLIVRVELHGRAPASFVQQRLWFLDQLEPGGGFYNLPIVTKLTGTLNFEALECTLTEIVRRHEVLRTTFSQMDGEPQQIISPAEPFCLPVIDLSDLPDEERQAEMMRLIREEAVRPFDLMRAPLLRMTLLRTVAEEHTALLTMHNIVSDGWSVAVFIREVAALYTAYCAGQPSPLEELPIQYADFAYWQRQWLQGDVLEQQLSYWRRQLAGAPNVELPATKPRPAVPTFRAAYQQVELSREVTEGLKALGRQIGVTLFMSLLAAFDVLLYRYGGQTDLPVATSVANRNQFEMEALIGFFVNTLVLRADLSGDPTFIEVLQRVREVSLEAYAHQALPFEKLVEGLQPDRRQNHSLLFPVTFVLNNMVMDKLELPGLSLGASHDENMTGKTDLLLTMWETNDGMRGFFKYNTDIFEASTIAKMVEHFQTLIENLLADPQQRLSNSSFLTEDETMGLTPADFPESGLSQKDFESLILQLNSSSSLK